MVKNAASEKQVASANQKEKFKRSEEIQDMRFVMNTIQGRRFVWRLMGHCKSFQSIYEQSARIHYNSGKQDVGFYIMRETQDADPDLWLKMQQENMTIKGDN